MALYTIFKGLLLSFLLIDYRLLVKCSPTKYRAPQPPNPQITQSDINATIIPTNEESDYNSDLNQVIFVSPDDAPERPVHFSVVDSTDSEDPSLSSLVEDSEPVKTPETQTTHKIGVDLDIENMHSNYYSYKKDDYLITYTAKNEYLFTSVKRYNAMIWKATKPREYSNKVVVNVIIKRVTIYRIDGQKKIFQRIKSGCCRKAIWEEIVEISR
ncbi:hypothetical protein MACK_002416 [Theileria orientalis]|uniref:Uncharacterized protein n=1 Tax=Theileria orientalis TaxID=68886 RepID=A0A976MC07_THEOR|nr:hypothetical protein MACK_002416 [Theileria orientalis]